jgi:hypothetical protein
LWRENTFAFAEAGVGVGAGVQRGGDGWVVGWDVFIGDFVDGGVAVDVMSVAAGMGAVGAIHGWRGETGAGGGRWGANAGRGGLRGGRGGSGGGRGLEQGMLGLGRGRFRDFFHVFDLHVLDWLFDGRWGWRGFGERLEDWLGSAGGVRGKGVGLAGPPGRDFQGGRVFGDFERAFVNELEEGG